VGYKEYLNATIKKINDNYLCKKLRLKYIKIDLYKNWTKKLSKQLK
jgi:hypothetical protein